MLFHCLFSLSSFMILSIIGILQLAMVCVGTDHLFLLFDFHLTFWFWDFYFNYFGNVSKNYFLCIIQIFEQQFMFSISVSLCYTLYYFFNSSFSTVSSLLCLKLFLIYLMSFWRHIFFICLFNLILLKIHMIMLVFWLQFQHPF